VSIESAGAPTPGSVKSWQEMREWVGRLLESRTGQDVAAWNERVAAAGPADESSLREWLSAEGVTGYPQSLLVWERFGYPEFLLAGAEQLIAGQYQDRPQLRPILDAVLAAVPDLGQVTVRVRSTLVSLVSPRRTFAIVQATTKSRVDLGLRLEGQRPEGRLLAARNLGAATVRIGLTAPEQVDEEVLGWLRRAFEENVAPAPPPKRAARPAPVAGSLTVVIEGTDLPGLTCAPERDGIVHRDVHVALMTRDKDRATLIIPGNPFQATEPAPADSPAVRWEATVTVRHGEAGYDFSGPDVRGAKDDRHLGLAWGELPGDGTMRTFRGVKLRLVDVPPRLIAEAMRPGHRLVARVRLTDAKRNPVAARPDPASLTWSAEPAD
jgi:Family of unknown function (DUF5990)/Domain of unknown function (DUF5655)